MIQSRRLISKTYFWMLEFHTLIVNKPWKFYPDVLIWNKIFFYWFFNHCTEMRFASFLPEKLNHSKHLVLLLFVNFIFVDGRGILQWIAQCYYGSNKSTGKETGKRTSVHCAIHWRIPRPSTKIKLTSSNRTLIEPDAWSGSTFPVFI